MGAVESRKVNIEILGVCRLVSRRAVYLERDRAETKVYIGPSSVCKNLKFVLVSSTFRNGSVCNSGNG